MPAIELDGVTKRFGNVVALRVEEGEVFGFLGPNGAGKSTTIDILLDYVRPTTGTARVFGRDAQRETRAVHERVGVLPDAYHAYDHLTARQHVAFVVESRGADDDPDELLHRVGILDAADRRVEGFSKGMRQRFVLGMALVGDPDLLVLDEPTTGLDPNGALAMLTGVLAYAVVFLAFGGSIPPDDLAVFLALGLHLGATYTGTGVSISAAVKTKNRALVGSVVFFLLTLIGWTAISNVLRYVLNGFSTPRGPQPEWAVFLDRLNPVEAYQTATDALMKTGGMWMPPGDAFYYTRWFALVVLVCWAVVPVALGYRRFRTVDL
ncbi:ATP-binding cassette domain-containing protein [Haladaptatus halobius]|uniref:ATP-binding cassette domain-containing protein n=1 Tax=Haladaptatus halobius TaxID=2884875 RepID=UPI001D0B2FA4|nr:ATP-binding cassette domain-containing protein [Haladaptatus halobius]